MKIHVKLVGNKMVATTEGSAYSGIHERSEIAVARLLGMLGILSVTDVPGKPEWEYEIKLPEPAKELWCAIVEHNGNEGEDFGYYFPQSEETQSLLRQIEGKIDEDVLDAGDCSYRFEHDVTDEMLNGIEQSDGNGYMARVHRCTGDDCLEALRKLATVAEELPYKASFKVPGGDLGDDWYDLRKGLTST